jgi:Icc-related predicted phosphoesterase
MKVLSLSDVPVQLIYSSQIRRQFPDVDLVIACGDLPYAYQEFIISMLDVPLYFVRGNHDVPVEQVQHGTRTAPQGGVDLHRRIIKYRGLILAGVEGSLRYRAGPYQYTQAEMWLNVISLVPGLLLNRLQHNRYLDVFVTHAPPRGIHDMNDLPHQGIDAFRWLIQVFKPAYFFHGHIHVYRPDTVTETFVEGTRVINTYGFRTTEVDCCPAPAKKRRLDRSNS